MGTINSPFLAHLAGVPMQESDTINPVAEGLIVGESPAPGIDELTIAASQTIAGVYVPVMFNAQSEVVIADGSKPAIGITLRPITTVAAEKPGQPILRRGVVAMHMIAWPAAYNTDALKLAAFRGADSPTDIIVKKVRKGSTVPAP